MENSRFLIWTLGVVMVLILAGTIVALVIATEIDDNETCENDTMVRFAEDTPATYTIALGDTEGNRMTITCPAEDIETEGDAGQGAACQANGAAFFEFTPDNMVLEVIWGDDEARTRVRLDREPESCTDTTITIDAPEVAATATSFIGG